VISASLGGRIETNGAGVQMSSRAIVPRLIETAVNRSPREGWTGT